MRKFIIGVALTLLAYLIAMIFTACVVSFAGWSEERALRLTLSILAGLLVGAVRDDWVR